MEPVKATFRPRGGFVPNPKLPLREQVHEVMRFKQFSLRTERAYWGWMKQFLVFCRDHPHLTPALAQAQTLTRPLATLSHPMGEGRGTERGKTAERERTQHADPLRKGMIFPDNPHLASPPSAVPTGEGQRAARGKQWRHPREMGRVEVERFLSHLATAKNVAVSTQNQALNALVFLYREVLHQPFDELETVERPVRRPKVPVVLSQPEVARLLERMEGTPGLFARLLYGTGLRLMEGLRLRVHPVR